MSFSQEIIWFEVAMLWDANKTGREMIKRDFHTTILWLTGENRTDEEHL